MTFCKQHNRKQSNIAVLNLSGFKKTAYISAVTDNLLVHLNGLALLQSPTATELPIVLEFLIAGDFPSLWRITGTASTVPGYPGEASIVSGNVADGLAYK